MFIENLPPYFRFIGGGAFVESTGRNPEDDIGVRYGSVIPTIPGEMIITHYRRVSKYSYSSDFFSWSRLSTVNNSNPVTGTGNVFGKGVYIDGKAFAQLRDSASDIRIIDTTTLGTLDTITLTGDIIPNGIHLAQGYVWVFVIDGGVYKIHRITPSDYTVGLTITLSEPTSGQCLVPYDAFIIVCTSVGVRLFDISGSLVTTVVNVGEPVLFKQPSSNNFDSIDEYGVVRVLDVGPFEYGPILFRVPRPLGSRFGMAYRDRVVMYVTPFYEYGSDRLSQSSLAVVDLNQSIPTNPENTTVMVNYSRNEAIGITPNWVRINGLTSAIGCGSDPTNIIQGNMVSGGSVVGLAQQLIPIGDGVCIPSSQIYLVGEEETQNGAIVVKVSSGDVRTRLNMVSINSQGSFNSYP